MPEDVKKNRTAILSSGKVNRYGYRLAVEGVKLDSFLANPMMLYVHRRSRIGAESDEEVSLPIGKWENIRIENGKLLADPVFDLEDEFAAKIARKWENGFLNATSVNHTFDEFSEAEDLVQAGQTRLTVTSWEILEASIVDIPGDPEAVKLNFREGNDPLSKLPLLSLKQSKTSKEMDLKKIAHALGLAETATEADVENALAAMKATQIEGVLSLGRQKGVVNDTNTVAWRTQVALNPEFARLSWEALPDAKKTEPAPAPAPALKTLEGGALTLAAALKAAGGGQTATLSDERKTWTLKDWRMKDYKGLLSMETENPEAFDKLVKSGVGVGMAVL